MWRAFGILRHAQTMSSGEALDLLSAVRLGVDLGLMSVNGGFPPVRSSSSEPAPALAKGGPGGRVGEADQPRTGGNGLTRSTVNELFIFSQPAHLQKLEGKALTAKERDTKRAQLIRSRLGGQS